MCSIKVLQLKCIIRESLLSSAIFNIFNLQHIAISNCSFSELLYEVNENYTCVYHPFFFNRKAMEIQQTCLGHTMKDKSLV